MQSNKVSAKKIKNYSANLFIFDSLESIKVEKWKKKKEHERKNLTIKYKKHEI